MSDATHPGRARRRAWICALAVCLAPTFVRAQEACVPPGAAISCEGVEAARPARRRAPPARGRRVTRDEAAMMHVAAHVARSDASDAS